MNHNIKRKTIFYLQWTLFLIVSVLLISFTVFEEELRAAGIALAYNIMGIVFFILFLMLYVWYERLPHKPYYLNRWLKCICYSYFAYDTAYCFYLHSIHPVFTYLMFLIFGIAIGCQVTNIVANANSDWP